MELSSDVKKKAEKIALQWKQEKLKAVSFLLTERYKNDSGKGKRLAVTKEEAAVYSVVRMPATYAAISDALKYTLKAFPELSEIDSAIDIGSGTGAAAIAICSYFENTREVLCIERERNMRELGEELTKVYSSVKWISGDITGTDLSQNADLIMESYMLNELSEENRNRVIDKLWDKTEKVLLLIEPGTMAGFEVLKDARRRLISRGAYIAAPCPHMGECRLSGDDWCHFTARVQRSKLHKYLKGGDVPYEDEKFSYMAFVREKPCIKGARILRHPITEKGMIKLSLCTSDENREAVITKKQGELFKAARKASCGDAIDLKS